MCLIDKPMKEKLVENGNNSTTKESWTNQPTSIDDKALCVSSWKSSILAVTIAPLTVIFANWFPFVIPYTHAPLYYSSTDYVYEEGLTRFDNSPFTYVTDYIVALLMAYGAFDMYKIRTRIASRDGSIRNSRSHYLEATCTATSGMLAFYAISVVAGGLSHQFFTSLEMMNTIYYKIMWCITVGCVTAAAGSIGAIGSYLALYFYEPKKMLFTVPIFPTTFWVYIGGYFTVVCFCGGISFHRPACDIFIAGTMQFVPTAYTIAVILSRQFGVKQQQEEKSTQSHSKVNSTSKNTVMAATKGNNKESGPDFTAVSLHTKMLFVFGFLANAPLLPVYPELLWLGLDLGYVNMILHCNLAIAWGLQYISIKQICMSQLKKDT